MDQLRQALTRRLAGAPVWLWVVVISGGIVAYAYLRRSRDQIEPAPAVLPYPDGSIPADAGGIPGIPPSDSGDDWRPTTNSGWARYVVDRARIRGDDPTLAHNAVSKVLAGIEVTEAEAAMWRELVTRYGPPPEMHPPIKVSSPAPSDPPPPPPPPPPPKKDPPAVGTRISVPLYVDLYTWTAQVQAGYNTPYDLNVMRRLNPGIDKYITWVDRGPGLPKSPQFRRPTPPVRIR